MKLKEVKKIEIIIINNVAGNLVHTVECSNDMPIPNLSLKLTLTSFNYRTTNKTKIKIKKLGDVRPPNSKKSHVQTHIRKKFTGGVAPFFQ